MMLIVSRPSIACCNDFAARANIGGSNSPTRTAGSSRVVVVADPNAAASVHGSMPGTKLDGIRTLRKPSRSASVTTRWLYENVARRLGIVDAEAGRVTDARGCEPCDLQRRHRGAA